MGTYTLTYNLGGDFNESVGVTAYGVGHYDVLDNSRLYTLQTPIVRVDRVVNGTKNASKSSGYGASLPTFSTINSISYRVTGHTLNFLQFTNASGSAVGLQPQGGEMTSAQLAQVVGLGSGARMTVTGGRTLTFKSTLKTSDINKSASGWGPLTLSRDPDKEGVTARRTVTLSTSQTVSASFRTTVTFYITTDGSSSTTVPGIGDTDDGGEGNYFNIEKGGVAVGQLCTGTTTAQKFEVNYPSNFNKKITAYNFKMSEGWQDMYLGNGITASTNTYGSSSGGAHYRVEGGHKVHVQASVKFTPLSSDNGYGVLIADGLPGEYCPAGKVYALAHVPVPNSANRTLYIIRCYVNPYGELWAEVSYANGTASIRNPVMENCQIDVIYEV